MQRWIIIFLLFVLLMVTSQATAEQEVILHIEGMTCNL